MNSRELPTDSQMYEIQHQTLWNPVYRAFESCLQVDPDKRADLEAIKFELKDLPEKSQTFPLWIHQSSALT